MNNFILVGAAWFFGILISVFIFLTLLSIKRKRKRKVVFFFLFSALLFLFAFIFLFIWIHQLDKNFTSLDKYTVEFEDEDIDRMTDFSRNRLATDFRLVSFVYGENYVVTIQNGLQDRALIPAGNVNITLDEALDILREEKPYIVRDVHYIFEEHTRTPYYNFEVVFDRNLLVSINAVTGEKQVIYFGAKGVW